MYVNAFKHITSSSSCSLMLFSCFKIKKHSRLTANANVYLLALLNFSIFLSTIAIRQKSQRPRMSSETVPFLCQFCGINATRVDSNDPNKKLPVSFCPNCCSRTRQEREQDAKRRLDNRVFFYGLTQHGYQQPIREAINPRFPDKVVGGPKLTDFQPTPDENGKIDYEKLSENFRYIDCYLGLVDGKHYGRFGRLRYQKVRHKRNPHGTEQRFCVPLANSFNYGWWTRDLRELNKTKWYAPRQRFPAVRGEVTKFVDDMAIHDPNFIFF